MLHLAILANAANYHMRRWLPALAARGMRVSLLSFVEPSVPIPDVDFHLIERATRRFARHSLADFLLGGASARKLVKKLSPDILMGSYATNYGFLGARTRFRPFVLQTWTADVQLYPKNGWRRHVLGPMVRHAMSSADLITTDGPALREVVVEAYPDCEARTESILWGIELEHYLGLSNLRKQVRSRLGIPDDAVAITCARGLRFHDRPEISLPALLEVLDANDSVFGIVLTLGHVPDERASPSLEALRAHARCLVVDRFLDSSAVSDIWSASDFVVSIPLFDGISETLLEAMAAGCIPILSDIPPNRIIVPDSENAIFTRADSAQALAADIRMSLEQLDRLKETAVPANRKWVRENASIENAAGRLTDLLKRLVEK